MPSYIFTAKNKQGQTQTGHLEAISQHDLASLLRQQGLILVSAEIAGLEKKSGFNLKSLIWSFGIFGRVPLVEKMVFTRHLAVMINAGLALNQGLQILANQSKNARFKKVINQIENEVRQGQAFSETLAKHPKIFNDLYVSMVQVGETGGSLNEVLRTLADQMKKDHDLVSRVRGAMIYPAVIVIVMFGIGILMMIVVVPKLTAIFEELKMDLPWTTRLIIGISNFITHQYIWTIVILVGLIIIIRLSLQNKSVKKILHKIYLHLPLLGALIKKINAARFARTFSSLIASGVEITKALKIISGTLTNLWFKETLIEAAQEVQKGKELNKALAPYQNLYTLMVIQMIEVGEQTGSLGEILKNLADFYEEEIDNTTKNLSSIIEPVIMVVIGAAVALFAISMIQPMYSMMSGV